MSDEPVPKLPYAKGLKLSWPEIVRIVMTGTMLVMVVVMQKPCADSVSRFVSSFDDPNAANSAGAKMPKPGNVTEPTDVQHVPANPTPEEIKATVDRSRESTQK